MAKALEIEREYDHMKLIEKRFTILVGGRLRDKNKMIEAVKKQDELRERFGKPQEGFSSVSELRKWRDRK
ncbi:MAG: hypothetical protein AB1397_01025 [bacterium]